MYISVYISKSGHRNVYEQGVAGLGLRDLERDLLIVKLELPSHGAIGGPYLALVLYKSTNILGVQLSNSASNRRGQNLAP